MIDFTDPRELDLRLLIERLKYERFVASEIDSLLTREFERIVDLIVSSKYRSLTAFQRQRATQLYTELKQRLAQTYRDVTQLQLGEMQKYAQAEAQIARETVTALYEAAGSTVRLGVSLPRSYLSSIARLPIQGLNIGEWFDAQANTMSREVKRIIQQGLIDGKGPLQIATKIVADDRAQGPVLLRRARNEARIVSRTVTNAVQNDAQMASLTSLPKSVSDRYQLVATRDTRTSAICRGLDGNVYRYDDPARRVPPFHLSCRTSVKAILLGIDKTIADQSTPPKMSDYARWLTDQPATVQSDILGRGRADLFREGKMSLAEAIDKDDRVLTLKELRSRLELVGA